MIATSPRTVWKDSNPYIGVDSEEPEQVVGAGEGLKALMRAELDEARDFRAPASRQENLGDRFHSLVVSWKRDTRLLSSVHDMVLHDAYQQIIGMGEKALPLLLDELRREPDHWFWALRAITGIDPVPPESRGHLPAMIDAWFEWGRRNKHLSA